MKEIIKYIIVNYVYKFIYKNSVVESFIGFRKRKSFENFLTIRKNVEFHGGTEVGAFSLFNRYTVVTKLVKKIGRFTSIGPNVYIAPGNHNYNQTTSRGVPTVAKFLDIKLDDDLSARLKSEKLEVHRDTFIGHDVWVGGHSIILNGVKVGDGAVVAANSVVTKDVEPYAIVGGVPAKFIKYRFDKDTIDKLIQIDFYNKPLDEIIEFVKKNPKSMVDVNEFIKVQQND